jgi:hypothetical protein
LPIGAAALVGAPRSSRITEGSVDMRMIASGLVSLGLAGCAAALPVGERMSGEAFMALARGNTMEGRGQDGAEFRTYVTPELVQRGSVRPLGGARMRFAGTIRATEYGICSASPELRNGQERCFEVWRDGTTFRTYWNGAPWTTMTIQPGNPHAL